MRKKHNPTHERNEQRPQIDPETAVRTMENFCHWLGDIHMRLCWVRTAIEAMADQMTDLDASKETWAVAAPLYVYERFLQVELLRLEYAMSEFRGTDKDEEAWQRFAKKYKKPREEDCGAPEP